MVSRRICRSRLATFTPGKLIVIFGRVDFDKYESTFVFFNPEFELDRGGTNLSSLDIGRIVPIYEESAGITSRQFRRIVSSALNDSGRKPRRSASRRIRNAQRSFRI